MMLLSCSKTPSPTTPTIKGCEVPRWPAKPVLHPSACGELVCLPSADVVALVKWERNVALIRRATERCSLIVWVDQ